MALTQTGFTFRWDPSTDDHGILSYRVSLDGLIIGETNAITTEYEVDGLQPGTTVAMRVQALDVDGLRSGWSEPLIVTTLSPPDGAPGWEPTYMLSLGEEDTNNTQEADICTLDSGLVVMASLSTYSYAIRLQAMNPATGELGPKVYFNNDWAGAMTIPVDPKGMAVDDLSFVIGMGDYRFAMVGNASDSYDADGTPNPSGLHNHVASWFDVDEETMEITRVGFSTAPWADFYSDEVTVARWNDTLVVLAESLFATGVAEPLALVDSTTFAVTLIDGHVNASGEGRNGPVAVSGDYAFYAVQGGKLCTVALSGAGQADQITYDLGGYGEWAFHSCTLSDGRIAMICLDSPAVTTNGPVRLAMITIGGAGQITVDSETDIVPAADNVGWTGGWYSNVRSISAMPDDTLLIGYTRRSAIYEERAHYWKKVNPDDGEILETGIVPGEYLRNTNNFSHQIVATGQDTMAALWIGAPDNSSNWGLYFTHFSLTGYTPGSDGWTELDLSESVFFDDGDPYGKFEDGKIMGAGLGNDIYWSHPDLVLGTSFTIYDYIEIEVIYDPSTGSTYNDTYLAPTPSWDGDTYYVWDKQAALPDQLVVRTRTGPKVWDWEMATEDDTGVLLYFEEEAVITGIRWRIVQSVEPPVVKQKVRTLSYMSPRSPVAYDGENQHMMMSVTNNNRYYSVYTEDEVVPFVDSGWGYTPTATSNNPYNNDGSDFVRDGLVPLMLYVDAETDKYRVGMVRPGPDSLAMQLVASHIAYPSQTFANPGFIRAIAVYPGYDTVYAYGNTSGGAPVNCYQGDVDVDGVITAWTPLGAVTYSAVAYNISSPLVISSTVALQVNTRALYNRLAPTVITDGTPLIPTTSGDNNLYDQFVADPRIKPHHLMIARKTSSTNVTKILDVDVTPDGTSMAIVNTWAIPGGSAYGVIMGWSGDGKGVAYLYNSSSVLLKGYYDIFGTPVEFTPPDGTSREGSSYIVPTKPEPDDGTYDSWLTGLAAGSNYAMVLEQYPLP